MKYQKPWTENIVIGSCFYTNHIVKTKSNFPLFSSKAKLFFDVFDEVVFFFLGLNLMLKTLERKSQYRGHRYEKQET